MIVWSWSTFSLVAGFILVAVATASVTGALVWRLVGNKDVVSSASTVQEVWPVLAAQDRATTDPFGDGQEELLRGRLTLKPKQGNAWLGGVFTPDAADTDAPLLVVQLEVQQPAEQEGAPPHRLLSWNSLEHPTLLTPQLRDRLGFYLEVDVASVGHLDWAAAKPAVAIADGTPATVLLELTVWKVTNVRFVNDVVKEESLAALMGRLRSPGPQPAGVLDDKRAWTSEPHDMPTWGVTPGNMRVWAAGSNLDFHHGTSMAGQPYGADINTLLSFLAVEGKYYPPPLPELGTVHWLVGGAVADASNIACTADLRLVPDGYGSISQGVGSGGSGGSVAEKGELLATINVASAKPSLKGRQLLPAATAPLVEQEGLGRLLFARQRLALRLTITRRDTGEVVMVTMPRFATDADRILPHVLPALKGTFWTNTLQNTYTEKVQPLKVERLELWKRWRGTWEGTMTLVPVLTGVPIIWSTVEPTKQQSILDLFGNSTSTIQLGLPPAILRAGAIAEVAVQGVGLDLSEYHVTRVTDKRSQPRHLLQENWPFSSFHEYVTAKPDTIIYPDGTSTYDGYYTHLATPFVAAALPTVKFGRLNVTNTTPGWGSTLQVQMDPSLPMKGGFNLTPSGGIVGDTLGIDEEWEQKWGRRLRVLHLTELPLDTYITHYRLLLRLRRPQGRSYWLLTQWTAVSNE